MTEATVTMPLAELARLQGVEERARACFQMCKTDLQMIKDRKLPPESADAVNYAGSMLAHVLEGS